MKLIQKYDIFLTERKTSEYLIDEIKSKVYSYSPKVCPGYRNDASRGSIDISQFLGKILYDISINRDSDIITIVDSDYNEFEMYHKDDCCEDVYVDDIDGDLNDLIDSPILRAESSTNSDDITKEKANEVDEHYTWTYYKLSTIKGSITIRWFGTSNGCYSETAYIYPKNDRN